MIRVFVVLVSMTVLTAGCDGAVQKLGQAADTTRSATERAAIASEASSNAREAKIYADARVIERREAARELAESGRRPRYEVRRVGTGWAIYDGQTGTVAKRGVTPQAGLSESQAYEAYESLKRADEDTGRALDALRPSGSR
jgi:hypothetical protein